MKKLNKYPFFIRATESDFNVDEALEIATQKLDLKNWYPESNNFEVVVNHMNTTHSEYLGLCTIIQYDVYGE